MNIRPQFLLLGKIPCYNIGKQRSVSGKLF